MNKSRFLLLAAGVISSLPWMTDGRVFAAEANANHDRVLYLDIAADCRTYAPTSNRGETNMVAGKIFPGGTLPRGSADNDPILPVRGIAPIGDWHHRSQNVLPLPFEIAEAYHSAPSVLATFFFFFKDGSSIVTESWGPLEVHWRTDGAGCGHRRLRPLQRRQG